MIGDQRSDFAEFNPVLWLALGLSSWMHELDRFLQVHAPQERGEPEVRSAETETSRFTLLLLGLVALREEWSAALDGVELLQHRDGSSPETANDAASRPRELLR
jgi:hypothetical protein